MSWVDDFAVTGKPKAVATVKNKMKKEFHRMIKVNSKNTLAAKWIMTWKMEVSN
jgi:hypothetical protein